MEFFVFIPINYLPYCNTPSEIFSTVHFIKLKEVFLAIEVLKDTSISNNALNDSDSVTVSLITPLPHTFLYIDEQQFQEYN
jgi:hypothetical protein